ncbi:MAG TPA: hypothetical protein VG052_01150 [Puia sp.]|jgi:hypothetical protein|nr:hypothetical protein [Puia sp.]
MKRILFFAILTIASTTLLWSTAGAQDKTHQSNDDDDSYFGDFSDNPGLWSAVVKDDKVHIQFGGHHWSSGASFALSELGPLPTDKQGSFTVKRDPGTVTFNGVFEGKRGHGTYAFEQDPAFRSFLAQEGFSTISEELMIHLYFTNINKAYFGYMKENGYTGITISELKHLAEENMNQVVMTNYFELFRKENYGKVPLDKVVELREHGVSPALIARFHEMGYSDISLDKAVTLVDHGVSPEFVEDMKKIGQRNITLDEAVELVDHGVSVGFVKELTDMGYTNISLEKATELVDHGVSASFIKEFKGLGFNDLTLTKAVELADHGVSAEFIKRMQGKGLKNLSLDEYIRLRDGGM